MENSANIITVSNEKIEQIVCESINKNFHTHYIWRKEAIDLLTMFMPLFKYFNNNLQLTFSSDMLLKYIDISKLVEIQRLRMVPLELQHGLNLYLDKVLRDDKGYDSGSVWPAHIIDRQKYIKELIFDIAEEIISKINKENLLLKLNNIEVKVYRDKGKL